MKKTYIIPAVNVMDMCATDMIAASLAIDTTQSGGEALVKEDWGDIWDDDEASASNSDF